MIIDFIFCILELINYWAFLIFVILPNIRVIEYRIFPPALQVFLSIVFKVTGLHEHHFALIFEQSLYDPFRTHSNFSYTATVRNR
jgi:hypothetical protein